MQKRPSNANTAPLGRCYFASSVTGTLNITAGCPAHTALWTTQQNHLLQRNTINFNNSVEKNTLQHCAISWGGGNDALHSSIHKSFNAQTQGIVLSRTVWLCILLYVLMYQVQSRCTPHIFGFERSKEKRNGSRHGPLGDGWIERYLMQDCCRREEKRRKRRTIWRREGKRTGMWETEGGTGVTPFWKWGRGSLKTGKNAVKMWKECVETLRTKTRSSCSCCYTFLSQGRAASISASCSSNHEASQTNTFDPFFFLKTLLS